jgi:hypothetical protein
MNKTSSFTLALLSTACAPFSPSEGTWIVDSFEIVENACNLETTDQTGESMILTNTDDGFTMNYDDDESYECTISNQDFECETQTGEIGESDPDSEFSLDLAISGSFTSTAELDIKSRVSLTCIVDDCSEYEEYFDATFPCATETKIDMSLTE